MDNEQYTFGTVVLKMENDAIFKYVLSSNNYEDTYKILKKGGNGMKTKKRNLHMYQYGGTIGPAHFPLFMKSASTKNHMLPRPVVSCRPGNYGHSLLNSQEWLRRLSFTVERYNLEFLENLNSKKSRDILMLAKKCKSIVPKCLRICDTFFTSMIVVGNFKGSGVIPLHKDTDDYITALVSIGDSEIVGGNTTYYSGKDINMCGKKIYTIPFKHGRIQIGFFDEIIHGADQWKNGNRGVIDFSMKKKLLNHFQEYGMYYYSQYIADGYPSGHFMAK